MDRTYRKPFPDWMTRNDPFTANWQDNGFFVAFEERRQRREGWLGEKLPTLYPRAQSQKTSSIALLFIYYYFWWATNDPLISISVCFCYSAFWIYFAVPPPNPNRLPYTVNMLFFPRIQRKKMDDLLAIPDKNGKLGEALLLDTIQYLWEAIIILYGFVIFIGQELLYKYLQFRYSIPNSQGAKYLILFSCVICGLSMAPFFLAKSNEVLTTKIIKDLRSYELRGTIHTVLHYISETMGPVIMFLVHYSLFAFQLYAIVGLIVFSLEWIIEVFITDPYRQLVTLQQLLCIVFLIPPLFFRKIRSWSMRTGEEKAIQARIKIKEQIERII